MLVDADGTDVVRKIATSVVSVLGKSTDFKITFIEGTIKTISEDISPVEESGPITKSTGHIETKDDKSTVPALLCTAFSVNLSRRTDDAPNGASADVNTAGEATPHGLGVGKSFMVSVAAVDTTDTTVVRNIEFKATERA